MSGEFTLSDNQKQDQSVEMMNNGTIERFSMGSSGTDLYLARSN